MSLVKAKLLLFQIISTDLGSPQPVVVKPGDAVSSNCILLYTKLRTVPMVILMDISMMSLTATDLEAFSRLFYLLP